MVLGANLEVADTRHLVVNAGAAAVFVGGLSMCVTGWKAVYRERDELAGGYTSRYHRHYLYWQLDPQTGEVLRRPGVRAARRRPQ